MPNGHTLHGYMAVSSEVSILLVHIKIVNCLDMAVTYCNDNNNAILERSLMSMHTIGIKEQVFDCDYSYCYFITHITCMIFIPSQY